MDSYIVHILRRSNADQDKEMQLDGVVEIVREGGLRHAFHNLEELWEILSGTNQPSNISGEMPAKCKE